MKNHISPIHCALIDKEEYELQDENNLLDLLYCLEHRVTILEKIVLKDKKRIPRKEAT